MAGKAYRCNWHVQHDGKDYKAGDSITLEKDEADELLKSGAVSDPRKVADKGDGEAQQ